MKRHGYDGLPAHCFWADSIAEARPGDVDPVVRAKFALSPADKVATAGSCFAQHISNFLRGTGFHFLVTETAHPLFADDALARAFNYGVFTARYGNIYTVRQWLQTMQRAYGLFEPSESFWPGEGGRVFDPFRPGVQPDGFCGLAELEADRAQHFAAVRRAVEQLDVMVFTLGLTEAWVCRESGAVYPVCPGVRRGAFDERRYAFRNFGVAEMGADLAAALAFVRARNPRAKFILTVSPVPLRATAENRSVLVSTTYSKSVLRVAAQEAADAHDYVDYFPAYEIVTGAFARGGYFERDLRSITPAALLHVMRLFLRHYAGVEIVVADEAPPRAASPERAQHESLNQAARAICEEDWIVSKG